MHKALKKKKEKKEKKGNNNKKKTPLKKRSEVELGLQLRHFLYSPTFESPEKACQQAVGKITTVYYEHCRTTPHFELSHADVYVLVPWSLSPQLHSLCLLQVWRKRARSGRSIQARQSEWSMTVQYRRELRKKQMQISIPVLISPSTFCPSSPPGQTLPQDKGSDWVSWKTVMCFLFCLQYHVHRVVGWYTQMLWLQCEVRAL